MNIKEKLLVLRDSDGIPVINEEGQPIYYLPTNAKVTWFRSEFPKGRISVERQPVFNPLTVCYKVEVYFDHADDHPGIAWEHQLTAPATEYFDSTAARCETIALGKALSNLGFGCDLEAEMNMPIEGDNFIPQDPNPTPKPEPETSPEPEKPRRGRKKKAPAEPEAEEQVPGQTDMDGILAMLNAAEEASMAAVTAEPEPEPAPEPEPEPEPKVDEAAEALEKAYATVLKTTDQARTETMVLEGMTLREILASKQPGFEKILLRPNVAVQLDNETVEALKIISNNR